jgi:hypothetical protein
VLKHHVEKVYRDVKAIVLRDSERGFEFRLLSPRNDWGKTNTPPPPPQKRTMRRRRIKMQAHRHISTT